MQTNHSDACSYRRHCKIFNIRSCCAKWSKNTTHNKYWTTSNNANDSSLDRRTEFIVCRRNCCKRHLKSPVAETFLSSREWGVFRYRKTFKGGVSFTFGKKKEKRKQPLADAILLLPSVLCGVWVQPTINKCLSVFKLLTRSLFQIIPALFIHTMLLLSIKSHLSQITRNPFVHFTLCPEEEKGKLYSSHTRNFLNLLKCFKFKF